MVGEDSFSSPKVRQLPPGTQISHSQQQQRFPQYRAIAPKPRGMPPLTHRGVGRPRMAHSYAAARAGMVAGPGVMAANLKRQLSPMPGGQQGHNSMENSLVWI